MKDADARALLRDLFDAALAAARPATCLAPYIDKLQPPKGRTVVIGAGKASAAMARAVEDRWHHPIEGLVVTRYGYGEACKRIEIVEAAHPVPDEKGRAAAGRILEKVKGLSSDDLVLCLISGGASALLTLPAPGLTLADKQDVNRALLQVGREHRRDEHGAKAPVGHQGRPPGRRRAARACPVVADLRRAQRRSRRDRLGPDRSRTPRPSPTRWRCSPSTESSRPPPCARISRRAPPARSRRRPSPAIRGWHASRR